MENKPKYQELADKWAKETGYDRAIFITQEDGYEVYFRQSMDPKHWELIDGGCEVQVTDGRAFKPLPASLDDWIEPYLKKALKGTGIRDL